LAHCPLCGTRYDSRMLALGHEVQPALVRLIQSHHAAWNATQGVCPRCLLHFVALLQSQRSTHSLQASTTPPTTFPYYHPAEENILPQSIRLPAHGGFDGTGVTVAFLDSGYYPHPDLTALTQWPDASPLIQLNVDELHALLAAQPLRLAHYVDLTHHRQIEGLETETLWDGASDSWHGEMTSTIALGNGLLSDGLFHGYAPGASGLLIKTGQGGGRISEEDILRGLNWLLEDDRWAQYGVRVLNVSVGGDFDEAWRVNAVCLAAEELSRRGVLIVAAAGNRGHELLVAPAQAPWN
jgi:serine protease AprX